MLIDVDQIGDIVTDTLSDFVLLSYVSELDRRVEDDTPAQAPVVGLVAVGHHTEVVGAADAEAGAVSGHHVPHRRVHRRTEGTMVAHSLRLDLERT